MLIVYVKHQYKLIYSNFLLPLFTVSTLEAELEQTQRAPPPPPPPLPPPPPPLPTLTTRQRTNSDGVTETSTGSAVLEMANLLGIPRRNNKIPAVPGKLHFPVLAFPLGTCLEAAAGIIAYDTMNAILTVY